MLFLDIGNFRDFEINASGKKVDYYQDDLYERSAGKKREEEGELGQLISVLAMVFMAGVMHYDFKNGSGAEMSLAAG
jgi:hypothetical protein